jgi:hypothetical protein
LIKKRPDIRPSEITSLENYINRRDFIRAGAIAGGSLLTPAALAAVVPDSRRAKLPDVGSSQFSTDETPNSYDDITTYNNFYEFGTGKDDPVVYAREFKPRPWTISVEGHAEKTGTFDFEDFIKPFDLEERIYRMRCVEAWSMVIPWVGISLAEVVKDTQRSRANARCAQTRARLALPRRTDNRRSNQPPPDTRRGHLWRGYPQPKRRTDSACCSMEVWFQRHQEHREDTFH